MPDAVFKDLCLDVTDAVTAATFWAPLLGLDAAPDRPRLDGVTPEQTIWLNVVPEPRTVKNRVHLDIRGGVADLVAHGATVRQHHPGWTVLADPEGAEFCAFPRPALPDYRVYELVIDAADPAAIAGWWADRLGAAAQPDDGGPWWTVQAAPMPYPFVFNPVPEPKTVKNRAHWDVWGVTADLLAAGATLLRARDESEGDKTIGWDVLADPEGNEFCVFTRA